MTQTEFTTTIKDLMDKFKEYENNLMAEFKESVNNIIEDKYVKVDKKNETQLQPLSLHVKEISSKQGDQTKLLSKFTATYDERLENMRNNNKLSTKFEISRTENEEDLKIKFYE